ncbi:MAG: thioredoxin [Flavobacteriaceae bacterium]|nr:thioredoxin [Flavobacteriaceae bacterium]
MSSFFEIIKSDQLVLVDFHAEWCGPCKTMSPILKEVKDTMGNAIKVLKIDVDKNQRLAASLNVRGVPTLILYKNNAIVWRQSGVVQKNDIISKINEYL